MSHTNVLTICATVGLSTPTIVCEHNDPAQCSVGAIWSLLRLFTYHFADAVTFLTPNVVDRWRPLLGESAVLMPNPVVVERPKSESRHRLFGHAHNLLAVGRLVPQKGFDLLLDAFRRVASKHKRWGLTILGDGALRFELEAMIEEYGLASRVHLAGKVTDPFEWFRQADLFVMSSRFEGFPCSLCEAMACGVPAISFDCDSGPRDIIRDGVDGFLVPALDVQALAATMDRLMSDPVERGQFSSRAPEVGQRYSLRKTLQRWDDLLSEVRRGTEAGAGKEGQQLDETRT